MVGQAMNKSQQVPTPDGAISSSWQPHPAAQLFPLMQPADLEKLAREIKSAGWLKEPILTHEGKILDGRNRLAACELAGIPPRIEQAPVNGGSPAVFAVKAHLNGRDLSVVQKSAIGAALLPILVRELKSGSRPSGVKANHDLAAEAVGVAQASIDRARVIMLRDQEAFLRMLRGEVESVRGLYSKVLATPRSAPKKTRHHPVHQRAAQRSMIFAISRIRGMCTGVAGMDVGLITSAMDYKERAVWAEITREAVRILKDFARGMEVGQ
jgi:hypothetical protein